MLSIGDLCGMARCSSSRSLVAALAVGLITVAVTTASVSGAPDQRRFDVAVLGHSGRPGHSFGLGEGLTFRFRDRRGSGTRYRVCWGPHLGHFTNCRHGVSSQAGSYNKIFALAPETTGYWTAKWFSHGRLVGTWSFYTRPR